MDMEPTERIRPQDSQVCGTQAWDTQDETKQHGDECSNPELKTHAPRVRAGMGNARRCTFSQPSTLSFTILLPLRRCAAAGDTFFSSGSSIAVQNGSGKPRGMACGGLGAQRVGKA